MKNLLYLLLVLFITSSCGEDLDDLLPLNAADYITPINNSVCEGLTTDGQPGVEVVFSWNDFSTSPSGITYTIQIVNINTSLIQSIVVENAITTTTVVLEPNTAYQWSVTATNTSGQTITGVIEQFQTPYEAFTNYTPFPAILNEPLYNDFVLEGDVMFDWSGNDPDEGETSSLVYDLFLSTTNTQELFVEGLTNTNIILNLGTGTYTWSIRSIDVNGNTSYSSIKTFIVQ
jgi:hypothetical protein